jgi:hypothetical protein
VLFTLTYLAGTFFGKMKISKMTALRGRVHRLFLALCLVSSFGISFFALLTAGCSHAPQDSRSASSAGEWHDFKGTWTAAGSRSIMQFGGDRRTAISMLNGSLVLAGASRPNAGFRAEAFVFNDTATGMVGRAVWTDEHGDQAFSELRGQGTADNNTITGTFVGGTGRFAGANGSYEFSWRFVLENEDGVVEGQSMGLKGRIRAGSQQTGSEQRGLP